MDGPRDTEWVFGDSLRCRQSVYSPVHPADAAFDELFLARGEGFDFELGISPGQSSQLVPQREMGARKKEAFLT